eukprot:11193505-Lingulodinium_polyedra.AAC.1
MLIRPPLISFTAKNVISVESFFHRWFGSVCRVRYNALDMQSCVAGTMQCRTCQPDACKSL